MSVCIHGIDKHLGSYGDTLLQKKIGYYIRMYVHSIDISFDDTLLQWNSTVKWFFSRGQIFADFKIGTYSRGLKFAVSLFVFVPQGNVDSMCNIIYQQFAGC